MPDIPSPTLPLLIPPQRPHPVLPADYQPGVSISPF